MRSDSCLFRNRQELFKSSKSKIASMLQRWFLCVKFMVEACVTECRLAECMKTSAVSGGVVRVLLETCRYEGAPFLVFPCRARIFAQRSLNGMEELIVRNCDMMFFWLIWESIECLHVGGDIPQSWNLRDASSELFCEFGSLFCILWH